MRKSIKEVQRMNKPTAFWDIWYIEQFEDDIFTLVRLVELSTREGGSHIAAVMTPAPRQE